MENYYYSKNHSEIDLRVKDNREKIFIYNHFKNYIQKLETSKEPWGYEPDLKVRIYPDLIERTKGLFNLIQLYYIYLEDVVGAYKKNEPNRMFEHVGNFFGNSFGDIPEFFKNVLDLDTILLEMLFQLMEDSQLFCDEKGNEEIPVISEDENEFLIAIERLNYTYAAIKKTKDFCRKLHPISSRIKELTREGFNIQPCWVDSGGVNSIFFLNNKKEIRIQIAASKFKGKGNCKNKSALCVVLPFPSLLFDKRNL
jgi:hypothetical protein